MRVPKPMSRRHSRCRCQKVACLDVEQARAIRLSIWATKGGQVKVRYYQCEHGSTHWTRMLTPQYKQESCLKDARSERINPNHR